MCGIAGLLDPAADPATLAPTAVAMARELAHRGPHDAGVWSQAEAGVALAHRRLAIVDLSAAGHQPMVSGSGRWVLVCNGEIYNHGELRAELEAAGCRFRGRSDSEVLCEACARWGLERTLPRLVGMFAFALWDRQARRLFLVRDRVGIKPLFWGRFGRLFLFGSELKALRAHPGWEPAIDRASLAAYLHWGHVPAPHSIYLGVHKLLPGTYLAVRPGGEPEIVTWWDPADVAARALADPLRVGREEAVEGLASLLGEVVAAESRADVPVGVFLSGGTDSSLIAALAQSCLGRPVHSFAVGFPGHACDESAAARAVARHLGTIHSEVMVSAEDARALMPELPRWFDEPLAVRSQIPAMMVSRLARRHVTVALCGEGGDELFGGYPGYFIVRALHRRVAALPAPPRRALAGLLGAAVGLVASVHRVLPAQWRKPLPLNQVRRLLAVARDGGDVADLYAELYSGSADTPLLRGTGAAEHPMLWQTPRHRAALADPIDRMGYFALLGTLVDRSLARVDRASMACSLEVRVPLLDHRLVEYAWRLPPAVKYAGRPASKPLLRALLRRYLPARLVDRPKKGFSSPLPAWLRGPLRAWAADLLSPASLASEGLFDAAAVQSLWAAHLAGDGDYWQILWTILIFRRWYACWRGSRPSARRGD